MLGQWPRYALNAGLIWYVVMVGFHVERLTASALWQALGLAFVVGTLLTGNAMGDARLRGSQVARFYLIPFCVSSFTAATGSAGFVVIVSPMLLENAAAALLVASYLGIERLRFRKRQGRARPSRAE